MSAAPSKRDQDAPGELRALDEHLAAIRDRIPITRVYEAASVDYLDLPIWSAVTPLAADLTVHSGRGPTHMHARVGAQMEAIERVCAEGTHLKATRSSFDRLSTGTSRPVDPREFDLPYSSAYDPSMEIDWIEARNLLDGATVNIAADLAVSPARDGVCEGIETNGLGAGRTRQSALRHALLEVIERDAISREAFADSHGEEGDFGAPDRRLVDLQSAPRQLKQLAAKLQASGVGLVLQFLEHGTGIPVLVAHLIDWGFPGMEGQPVSFEGSAADLDVERAAIAAVTEAAQAHTVTLLGAREVIEGADSPLERPQTLLRRNRLLFSGPNRSWGQIAGAARGRSLSRPEADLEAILAAIRDAGHEHAIAVDLTRPDLEIPVVRVLVSGMAQPYGFSTRRPPRRLLAGLA